jgi:dephospho-CoA kinase
VLRVGLTGGIGSGKSTVARRLVEHGAMLVDSDVLAREVVGPGTDGLAAVVEEFGGRVLGADGRLDRPALASIVFGDEAARTRLNRIVHPRVRARSEELIAAAPADAVVVQDVPLLVEGGMAPAFPLVVVVHSNAEVRVRRLVAERGMPERDARARIAAQADDDERRAVADVWLDNSGTLGELVAAVDALWRDRLVRFEENVRLRRAARVGELRPVDPDPRWAADGARLAARVAAAAGERGRGAAHIGPTAVPGLPAPDVVDLQLGVDSPADADALADALAAAAFPACAACERGDPAERCHGSADPARPARLHLRVVGSPAWRHALLVRDWLRADPAAGATIRWPGAGAAAAGDLGRDDAWSAAALRHAQAWAVTSGWVPSLP